MEVIYSQYRFLPTVSLLFLPMKLQSRRTATAVLAGNFAPDVLTSHLKGVGPHTPLLRTDDEVQNEEKRKNGERKAGGGLAERTNAVPFAGAFSISIPKPTATSGSFSRARPHNHIVTMQRCASVTPPPCTSLLLPSTPTSITGPYNSSSAARASFKWRHIPDDDPDFGREQHKLRAPRAPLRAAAKKGWKGWVEGIVPVLPERRTRSGKKLDGIVVGKEGCA
ncbi:hypothetical protein B0H14DRAFT_3107120 [Mycena olivaceomarginata]|nr:hypothetical protein B0H14DRAFT_3107120 [Mycena olivaceomarginata]